MTANDQDSPSENLLTTKEFSERSGTPIGTIQKMLRGGKLTGTKLGNRWYIAPSELTRMAADEDSPPVSAPATKSATSGTTEGAAATSLYSVAEFAALTYLTELGVERWLQQGRLAGERAGDGSWRVKAESLKLPLLRHLIR